MEKFNIKKLVVGLLAIMIIAYGIGAIVVFTSPKSSFNIWKSSIDINNTNSNIDIIKTASLSDIKNIKVSVSSAAINVIPTNDPDLRAHLNGSITSSSNAKFDLECYSSGNTLYINVTNSTKVNFGFFYSSLKLDVYIPSSYANELRLSSSSGSINVKDLKLTTLQCNVSSGGTTIDSVIADNFEYTSSSGSLNANGLITKTSKLANSSGSKRLKDFTGDLKSTSSSGSTKVEYSSFDNNIDITASSGSVEVILPENANFYLDSSASSGSIKSDFPITVSGSNDKRHLKGTVGNDKNKVKIHTSSGSIRITR
jgi:lia operon protein LiaG